MTHDISRRHALKFGLGGAALAAIPRRACAATAAEFFKGKTIRLLVGSPAGGGYDLYARMLAPHFAQKLDATVIVENRDGNGGLMALTFLLGRPADGLNIMHASAEAAALSQLLERDGCIWDVATLQWLAKTSSAPKLWFFGKKSRFSTIEEARRADRVVWAATGPADNISDVAAIISDTIGLKSKIVIGYKGAGDMSLAVISGEADAGILSADSALNGVRAGDLKPVAIFDEKRWPGLPDVPTLGEIATIPADKKWLVTLREQIGDAQRAMVAAPGTPPDRVEFLRDVWAQILTDPAVIAEGVKSRRELNFLSGADLQQRMVEQMKAASPRAAELKKIVLESYF